MEASALQKDMLRAAIEAAGIRPFRAWYEETLGKPFTVLQVEDVKPLLDAAYFTRERQRVPRIAPEGVKEPPDAA